MYRKNYGIENIVFNDSDIIIDCGANFGALWIFLDSLNLTLNYIGIELRNLNMKVYLRV